MPWSTAAGFHGKPEEEEAMSTQGKERLAGDLEFTEEARPWT